MTRRTAAIKGLIGVLLAASVTSALPLSASAQTSCGVPLTGGRPQEASLSGVSI